MHRVFLVRHAESLANAQGIYQGQTYDTDLSPLGYLQAQRLGMHLSSQPLDRIIASPLIRTLKTAAFVATYHPLEVSTDRRILEVNHGAWEGKPKAQVAHLWPTQFFAWQNNPSQAIFPGGERSTDTQSRVLDWWSRLDSLQGTTLVVSHDAIIRILLSHLERKSLDQIWDYTLHPTAVTEILDNQVVRINDTSHMPHLANLSAHAL